jgi:hypothetical protein
MVDSEGNTKSVLCLAIEALALATTAGNAKDLNQEVFSQAHTALVKCRDAIVEHDGQLDWREIPPTGDDYNWLLSLLGVHQA